MDGLKDKVVIVAGSASGLGAATARKLATSGAKVVLGDINGEGAAATAASIADDGGTATSFRFDITDEQSIADLFAYTLDTHGRVDGLHANVAAVALTPGDTNLLDIDVAVWERMLQVNMTGNFLMMRHAVRQMLEQGGGSIVYTSSAAAFAGDPVIPAYSSTKAGMGALVRHIASAYGRQGVRCNAVAPGSVATEGAIAAAEAMGGDSEEWFNNLRENVAFSHRDGTPDDIATMVALLLSDDGSWINGQCYCVDGGWIRR